MSKTFSQLVWALSLIGATSVAWAQGAPQSTAPSAHPQVEITTSMGVIVLELDAEKAPRSVANFLVYVDEGFYDGLIFHRVIDGFMIQGGGFDKTMQKKEPKAPIMNEADNGLRNARGTIAMARTNDPHSGTSQFFINTVDNRPLDHRAKDTYGWGYAVFGKVIAGMDVVDAIAKVKTGRSGVYDNVPAEPVVIVKAKRKG